MATPRNDTPRARPERGAGTEQGKKLRGLLTQTKPAEFDAAARERVGGPSPARNPSAREEDIRTDGSFAASSGHRIAVASLESPAAQTLGANVGRTCQG